MPAPLATDRYSLIARRATLVQRLEDGDQRIAAARRSGADTVQWEKFWLQLLDEYVEVSECLDRDDAEVFDVAA